MMPKFDGSQLPGSLPYHRWRTLPAKNFPHLKFPKTTSRSFQNYRQQSALFIGNPSKLRLYLVDIQDLTSDGQELKEVILAKRGSTSTFREVFISAHAEVSSGSWLNSYRLYLH
jgi:hypothetical protein